MSSDLYSGFKEDGLFNQDVSYEKAHATPEKKQILSEEETLNLTHFLLQKANNEAQEALKELKFLNHKYAS